MDHTSNKHAGSVADIFEQTLEETAELLVVNPAAETVTELIEVAAGNDGDPPEIRVLATDRALKDAFEDFLIASSAADLTDQGSLALRTTDLSHNTLVIADEAVFALVVTDQRAAALASDDDAFIAAVESTYRTRWEDGEPYQLRTPPISRVRETLEAEIGEETQADFDRVLDALEATDMRGEFDEVTVSLLVAAKNNVLLYDISRWGEDVGIASKATFSRTKTQLEEYGLIDTEKVPIDVGRPRLRLQLGNEQLKDADVEELVSVVRERLAE